MMLNSQKIPSGFMVAMGIIIGTVVGALTGNVGIWITIGIVIGVALKFGKAKNIRATNPPDTRLGGNWHPSSRRFRQIQWLTK